MKLSIIGTLAFAMLGLIGCAQSPTPEQTSGDGELGDDGFDDQENAGNSGNGSGSNDTPSCTDGFARVDLSNEDALSGARALVEIGGSLRIVATTGLTSSYDGNGALLANSSFDLGAGLTSVVAVDDGAFLLYGPKDCTTDTTSARLIFSTEGGRLIALNPDIGDRDGVVVVDRSGVGADYKGIAVLQTADGPLLLAADFFNGRLDVFDANYQLVDLGPNAFDGYALPDPSMGLTNVAVLDGFVYITYARKDASGHQPLIIAGGGLVARFTPTGEVVGQMGCSCFSRPFGLAMAPAGYLATEKRLLVANKGYGGVVGVDPNLQDGTFLDFVERPDGELLEIDGLTGIGFGAGAHAGTLFFTATPDDGSPSTFGRIESACE